MRYIGSKNNILPFIESVITGTYGNVDGAVFADIFAGTACVGARFKELGAQIISNDYLSFSYCIQMEKIGLNTIPIPVSDYCNILDNLNSLPGEAGFFFNEYTLEGTAKREFHRNYFSKDNAMHIDAIRSAIREIEESSCFPETIPILLKANLIDAITRVSNTAGTYGSFLKIDDGRKFKQLELTPSTIFDNGRDNQCYCMSAEKIIDEISGNILYLDPPYNERQYPPYYHILETIALGDNPEIYGLTGRRPYQDKKSSFCKKNIAKDSLKSIIIKADFSNIYLSYNTDGIVSIDDLADDLSKDFEVKVFDRSYRRYCSGKSRKLKMPLKEIVLYVKKR